MNNSGARSPKRFTRGPAVVRGLCVAAGVLASVALSVVFFLAKLNKTPANALPAALENHKGAGMVSNGAQVPLKSVTFVGSSAEGPNLADLKARSRALREKRDAIGAEIRELPKEYWNILAGAVQTRPDLMSIFEQREDLDRELDETLRDPRIRDLASWSIHDKAALAASLAGSGINVADPAEVERYLEFEAAKIRKFYFLHEMNGLLDDQATKSLAESWLSARVEPTELDRKFYSQQQGRKTLFDSFREFSDEVVPDPMALKKLLETPDRTELVNAQVVAEGLDYIDSSLPVGIEELLLRLTSLGMKRALFEHHLRSEIPLLQQLEDRRRELLLEHPRIDAEVRAVDSEIRKTRNE